MEQPPRFVAQGEIGRVCRLRKFLYGLGNRESLSSSKVFVWFEADPMRGLVNSVKPLRNLACKRVNPTTPSFIGTPTQVSFF